MHARYALGSTLVLALFGSACGPNQDDPDNLSPDVGDTTPEPDTTDDVEVIGPFCGDGVRDEDEACDGEDLGDATCPFGGEMTCAEDCTVDTSACDAPPSCGDGVIQPEEGEVCDGDAPFDDDCASLGEGLGELACNENCLFDTSACTPAPRCGDGIVQPPETCDDGNTIDGDGCSQGCEVETCGDGILQPGETCEAASLTACDGAVGVLPCEACELGTPICPDASTCGDGVLDYGERCDDGNTDDDATCSADCATSYTCNNEVREAHEACDGEDVAGLTCADFGFTAGELRCADCALSLSGCFNPRCGDGVIEGDEACDDGGRVDGDGCSMRCELEPCFDRYDPTERATAEVLGTPDYVSGRVLAGGGASDWYTFTLEDADAVYVDASAGVTVNLYVDDVLTPDEVFPFALSNATGAPQTVTLEVSAAEDTCTTYALFVADEVVCDHADDEFEDNDGFESPFPLAFAEDLAWGLDADLYEVTLDPGCGVALRVGLDARRWYDLDGQPLSASDHPDFEMTHVNTTDAPQTLRSVVLTDAPICEAYSLEAGVDCTCPALDAYGGINAPIAIAPTGATLTDQVASPAMPRVYDADLCAGGTLIAQVASDTPPMLILGDLNTPGDPLAIDDEGVLVYTAPEATTVRLRASVDPDDVCGRFDLRVAIEGCTCSDDVHEPNNELEQASPFDVESATYGQVADGDADWFTIPPQFCESGAGMVHVSVDAFGGEVQATGYSVGGLPLDHTRTQGAHGGYLNLPLSDTNYAVAVEGVAGACVSYAVTYDTSCVRLCYESEYVWNGACATCPVGTARPTRDNPTGPDTVCEPILCEADYYVASHYCQPCPAGTINDAGDDASGENTVCDPAPCGENEHVVGGACEACPADTFRPAGDDPTAGDTRCSDACTALLGVSCDAFEQGYIKASNPNAEDRFGYAVAVDGDTLVVGATGERSANGDPANNTLLNAGAVYVFTRTGTTWAQEAYLKASFPVQQDLFGAAVAIRGDTLIVGAPGEWGTTQGINGAQDSQGAQASGAVFVFERGGTTWALDTYIKASNAEAFDRFGTSVDFDGTTLVVGAPIESSNDPTQPANNGLYGAGAAYVFTRAGGVWVEEAYLKGSGLIAREEFGTAVAVDGDRIVVGAPREPSGDAGDATDTSATDAGAAYVFERSGTSWTEVAYLKASNIGAGDRFGDAVDVSGDTIVVGATSEDSASTGVDSTPDDTHAFTMGAGAVYVFTGSGAAWTQEAYIKPLVTGGSDLFGTSVIIEGDLLVIGAPGEASADAGLEANATSDSQFGAGAVYLFERGAGGWAQLAYIKGPYSGAAYNLGASVALSGGTLVSGEPGESSNAVGVGGDPTNTDFAGAGAVLVWDIGR